MKKKVGFAHFFCKPNQTKYFSLGLLTVASPKLFVGLAKNWAKFGLV